MSLVFVYLIYIREKIFRLKNYFNVNDPSSNYRKYFFFCGDICKLSWNSPPLFPVRLLFIFWFLNSTDRRKREIWLAKIKIKKQRIISNKRLLNCYAIPYHVDGSKCKTISSQLKRKIDAKEMRFCNFCCRGSFPCIVVLSNISFCMREVLCRMWKDVCSHCMVR